MNEVFAFLDGGGSMGALIRAHDWAATPLGPLVAWPLSLRSVVALMVRSRQPTYIAWGPEQVSLYNDGYIPFLGSKHPAGLGQPAALVWSEIWETLEPLNAAVLAGKAQWFEDMPFTLAGRDRERSWFSFSYTPLVDDGGAIAGFCCVATETTDRILAERRASAEAERQRTLFEQAPGFTAVLDGPEHVFAFANRAYLRLVGERDLVGKTVREALPEIAGQGFYELLDSVFATGERFVASGVPIQLMRSGPVAEERFVDFVYEPIRNDDGGVSGIFVQGSDVTEGHAAQQALRESEEFNRRILASSTDCIKVLDLDGRLTFMSEGGQGVMEVSDFNTIRGCPWPNLWEGRGHAEAEAGVAAARSGRSASFQGPANTMAGTPRWWDVQITPILDADGRPEKILAVSRDITALHRAEEGLRALNETLEQRVEERTRERDRIWRNSQDIQVVVDAAGVFQAVNPAFTTILGWLPDDVLGRSVFDFVIPEDVALTDRALQHARTKTLPVVENRYRHKDGGVCWISWVASPEEGMIYGSGRNITAEKEQAEALQVAEAALRQAQKMEAVGQLTGGLAHDFNNLLAGIAGSLELMERRVSQGRFVDLERYMTVAQGAARRAAALTHRLLAFSRQQTLDPKPTDVNRLVTEMEELVQRTIGPTIKLKVVGAAGLWPALIDPGQLENAVLNLCINARDAMPDGGRITIETENNLLDELAAHERDLSPGQYLSVSVSDTGTGMSPELVTKIFEPFFTTKPIGEGTGLGLSMVYGFARQSGGQVRIQTAIGEGTAVRLYLPRHHGESDVEEASSKVAQSGRAEQGETVLIVDDEPSVRMLVTEILEDLGYTPIEAADSISGLKVLQSDIRIDLLVTDVGLPGGMNGRQMADAARIRRPGLKVLFITGYAENSLVGSGHLASDMAVLTKPFAIETMAARVRSMIEVGKTQAGPL